MENYDSVIDRFFNVIEEVEDLIAKLVRENAELKEQLGPGSVLAHSNQKKLGPEEVQGIRTLNRLGWTNKSIAETYDVNPATVSRIVRGIYHK